MSYTLRLLPRKLCAEKVLESPDGALRQRLGSQSERRLLMDVDSVTATCNIFLVVIGIIGLLLMMRNE